MAHVGSNPNLDQEVLLGIMMEWGDSARWPKPGIDGDRLFLSITEAAVVRDADVLLQLRDLKQSRHERL